MERSLEIEGEFLLDYDGGTARIEIKDEVVDVQLPGARSALSMTRQISPSTRRDGLRRADAVLRGAGLIGRIRIRGRTVARLGGNAEPGPLARLLGVDPLALSIFSFIGAALDRRRLPSSTGGPAPVPPDEWNRDRGMAP